MMLEASVGGALAGCGALASLFVGSLYLVPASVRSRAHSDEVQIRWRFSPSAVACALSPALLWAVFGSGSERTGRDAPALPALLGIRAPGLLAAATIPFGLIVTLFAGTLLDLGLRRSVRGDDVLGELFPNCPRSSTERVRNLVVAPFAEELVFRCCMGSLLHASGLSAGAVVAVSPLFFGVAHLHHCYGMVQQGVPVRQAVLTSAVQMTYTTLFGALEMFLFLRTGHLAAVFAVHSWCNLAGLPSLAFLHEADPNHGKRHLIGAVYAAGIAAFALGLGPLTSPALYRNDMYL